ncbi:zinc transporter ZIP13-like [Mantella aurantiaca]
MMWGRIAAWLCFVCLGFQLSSACTPGSRACENANVSSADAWICSLIGSLLVGLSGVLPLLVIPIEAGSALRSEESSKRLKQLLSFAIGGLLGDVFVHLLPEAWAYTCSATTGNVYYGYSTSWNVGILTTAAILLHEIPHEVGDFAILLRAGFDRWSAARMQLMTAMGGILGAGFAVCAQSPKGAGETVAWILPFTSGGFLYIALVNVLPDLLAEESMRYVMPLY